jgi:hypothetical protein
MNVHVADSCELGVSCFRLEAAFQEPMSAHPPPTPPTPHYLNPWLGYSPRNASTKFHETAEQLAIITPYSRPRINATQADE